MSTNLKKYKISDEDSFDEEPELLINNNINSNNTNNNMGNNLNTNINNNINENSNKSRTI